MDTILTWAGFGHFWAIFGPFLAGFLWDFWGFGHSRCAQVCPGVPVPVPADHQGEVRGQDPHRALRDRRLVLLALPRGLWEAAEALDLRVLPQVHEVREELPPAPGPVPVAAAAGPGDLPQGEHLGLRGGRQGPQDLLPEPVPAGQAVPGPQDALLRRGALRLLPAHRGRSPGRPHRRLLLQGKGVPGREQRGVHPDPAPVPAPRLRQIPHRLQLRAVQAGEHRGLPGEAALGPGQAQLPQLLVLGAAGDPPGLQGHPVHQGPQPDDQHHSDRHHQHAAVPEHGQVLEGAARHLRHAQAGGGAPQERPVQEAAHHRGLHLPALGAPEAQTGQGGQEVKFPFFPIFGFFYPKFLGFFFPPILGFWDLSQIWGFFPQIFWGFSLQFWVSSAQFWGFSAHFWGFSPNFWGFSPKFWVFSLNFGFFPQILGFTLKFWGFSPQFWGFPPPVFIFFSSTFEVSPNFGFFPQILCFSPKFCVFSPNSGFYP
ncbi:histone acetyltransferase KAT8 isoform X2 [Haemorhous mexicanus]|uniref:histone acetyltransferase KAT8 isoform X2 n=1 Tax=Haemorhous mexicanus TaxID=30427 RepID=UPI0028BD32FE|nr:histone acetyltransferase KAT8 isoform X2 [Haemorhous mexicanus]